MTAGAAALRAHLRVVTDETFTLTSSAFEDGARIPARHTCDGDDVSPPLGWTAPPPGTRSLALVVSDPDAPDPRAPKTTWTHWIAYDLPPASRAIDEGREPAEARPGLNDWKRPGWGGPCPPIGEHRYVFDLYALDAVLGDLGRPTRRELLAAIEGHVLAHARLVGRYARG